MSESALETVSDYIDDVRVLLQDTIAPYRYDDDSLLASLNIMLLETRRLRPDLFVYKHHERVPFFTAVNEQEICLEHPFRPALVYGIASHALARDQEDVQDERSSSFMRVFNDMLLGLRPSRIEGATPDQQVKGAR